MTRRAVAVVQDVRVQRRGRLLGRLAALPNVARVVVAGDATAARTD